MVGNVSLEVTWLAQVFVITQWQYHDSEKVLVPYQCSFRNTRMYLLMPRIMNKSCSPLLIFITVALSLMALKAVTERLFPAVVLWKQRHQPTFPSDTLQHHASVVSSVLPSQSRRITDLWHAELVGTWNLTRLGVPGLVPSQARKLEREPRTQEQFRWSGWICVEKSDGKLQPRRNGDFF